MEAEPALVEKITMTVKAELDLMQQSDPTKLGKNDPTLILWNDRIVRFPNGKQIWPRIGAAKCAFLHFISYYVGVPDPTRKEKVRMMYGCEARAVLKKLIEEGNLKFLPAAGVIS